MKNFKLRRTAAIIGYTVLSIVLFSSCGSNNDNHPSDTYEIKVIDGCEYIYVSRRPWSNEFALTHKGNCKYCKARSLNNR